MKIICNSCGKEIKKGEQMAVFLDGQSEVYTHVGASDNKYDCDYVYMLETLCPEFRVNE